MSKNKKGRYTYIYETVESKIQAFIEEGYLVIKEKNKLIVSIELCCLYDMMLRDFPNESKQLPAGIKRRRLSLSMGHAAYIALQEEEEKRCKKS